MATNSDTNNETTTTDDEPPTLESVYLTRVVDNRTGESCGQIPFSDLATAKEYLEEYVLIRFGATGSVWREADTQGSWRLQLEGMDGRAVVSERIVHDSNEELLETVRELQAEVSVDVIA